MSFSRGLWNSGRARALLAAISEMSNLRAEQDPQAGQASEESQEGDPRVITISADELRALLNQAYAADAADGDNDEEYEENDDQDSDDDDHEEDRDFVYDPQMGQPGKWYGEVKEPKQKGLELLMSGDFGRIGHQRKLRGNDNNIAKTLLSRTSRVRPVLKEDVASDIIPNTPGVSVANYSANAYVGQYSSDSTFYYTCVRDFRLHIYDTTAPLELPNPTTPPAPRHRDAGHETSMKVIKTISAYADRWTITDSHLSPDNQRMIYATVSNNVYMTTTLDPSPLQTRINFSDSPRNRRERYVYDDDDYGIWSCKFSADGNEIVAGGRAMIFVYDLLAQKRTVKIFAHTDDINSCCWADTASGNVLVSASDDTFLKVWDRRSLGSSNKPSGALIGHTEGITYVSAKGDGRYVVSNGKDQVLRLWDLRMMRSNSDLESVQNRMYGIKDYDYRTTHYPVPRYRAHPLDCSVMHYTGHEVLRTLIRCHFSPAETTGSQYVYSGSADGRIHVWSLDGRVVQVLDRSNTMPMSVDPSGPIPPALDKPRRRICVRDVSWHSQLPILMSAGWLGTGWGSREGSIIARHEWKGLSKMSYNLVDHTEKQASERAERAQRRSMLRGFGMPRSLSFEDDDF